MTRSLYSLLNNGIHDPAWAQAYSSFLLVGLTLITLAVLCVYAWDTHKLAKSSIEQVKNAQMPFLALVKIKRDNPPAPMQLRAFVPPTSLAWAVQNQGNAAAVNIIVKCNIDDEAAKESSVFSEGLNPIAVGAWTFVSVYPVAHITNCTIEYSSLDVLKFRTDISTVDDDHHLEFHRL